MHQIVETRPKEVEGAKDGIGEAPFERICMDHSLEQLLRRCIDPTLLAHRAHHKFTVILLVRRAGWSAINLGCRILNESGFGVDASLQYLEVGTEVEVKNLTRPALAGRDGEQIYLPLGQFPLRT